MHPLTIGGVVSILAGHGRDAGAEAGDAGWGLANQIVERTRGWLADVGDEPVSFLKTLETTPDSEAGEALARQIDHFLNPASQIGRDLRRFVDAAKADKTLGPVLAGGARKNGRRCADGDNGSKSALFADGERPQWQATDLADLFPASPENN